MCVKGFTRGRERLVNCHKFKAGEGGIDRTDRVIEWTEDGEAIEMTGCARGTARVTDVLSRVAEPDTLENWSIN